MFRNAYRAAKWIGKNAAKTATNIAISRGVSRLANRKSSNGMRGGGAHASQPGHSGWHKATTRRRKTGRKTKRGRKKCGVSRAEVLKMIHKEDPMPQGEYQETCTSSRTLNQYTQVIMDSDTRGGGFPFVVDYWRLWDAQSVLFNGKGPGNTYTTTGNTPLDVPVKGFKNYAECKLVNNTLAQVEVDMYVATPKIMTDFGFFSTWNSGYDDLQYLSGGTGPLQVGQKNFDMNATAAQIPNLKKFYTWTKTTFNLLPGETRKEIIKGPTKRFLPQDYTETSSTTLSVNNFTYVPGSKQFGFIFRSIIGSTTLATQPRHVGTSGNNQIGCEIIYRQIIECPESASIALRRQALGVFNYTPYPGTDGSSTVANVYNPVTLTAV